MRKAGMHNAKIKATEGALKSTLLLPIPEIPYRFPYVYTVSHPPPAASDTHTHTQTHTHTHTRPKTLSPHPKREAQSRVRAVERKEKTLQSTRDMDAERWCEMLALDYGQEEKTVLGLSWGNPG